MRGFASIGLFNPKDLVNVGGVLRAAGCYEVSLVAISGLRYLRRNKADTQAVHRHTPVLNCDDLKDVIPVGAVPVAVDLIEGATALQDYVHPQSAFYVFGPEDGTLDIDWCRDTVYIPTKYCMNLAATVNVVLYDRMAKQGPPLRNTSKVVPLNDRIPKDTP